MVTLEIRIQLAGDNAEASDAASDAYWQLFPEDEDTEDGDE